MDLSTDQHSSPESTTPEPTRRGTKKGGNTSNNANNTPASNNPNRRSKSMRACDECRKRKVKIYNFFYLILFSSS